jgi:hypothetical protein
MDEANSGQTNPVYQMANFVKKHQLSIGLWLIFFGVADLSFVMPNMYAVLLNWHVARQVFSFYMPEWIFTIPILLIISLIGTLMLCVYSIRDIRPERVDNKEHAAIIVTALGFTYQVIGAWPLFNQPYPWPWQQEIANYGNLLVFPLFIGSLLALIIGVASLYIHSKIYHEKHPETSP